MVRRARFRDRPGTFLTRQTIGIRCLRDRCRLPHILHESACAHRRSAPTPVSPLVPCRPAVSLHATTPVPASAARSKPCPHWFAILRMPFTNPVSRPLRSSSCRANCNEGQSVAACDAQDSALQSGCAAFTEARTAPVRRASQAFFRSFDQTTTPSVGHSTTT